MSHIFIATEDVISTAVAEKLVSVFTRFQETSVVWPVSGRGGNGHLRANLKSYFEIARRYPFLLMTDLDTGACAPALLDDWRHTVNIQQPQQMLFRVVVREIESWLLADFDAAARLLNTENLPIQPDTVLDPKQELIRLARNASRDVRDDIVPRSGAATSRGIGYNTRLVNFVRDMWCPVRASQNSDSLRRCCAQLSAL